MEKISRFALCVEASWRSESIRSIAILIKTSFKGTDDGVTDRNLDEACI
jgi:hypothetical protein